MDLRDSFGVWTKLKESIFNNNDQINSIVTTRTWVLSTEWTKYRILLKNGGGPRLFEWYMLFFRVRGYCMILTKLTGQASASSTFSRIRCQSNFSEIFKGRQSILNSGRNSKYPMRYLLWWHKTPSVIWTEAYSEPLQETKKECFCVNS